MQSAERTSHRSGFEDDAAEELDDARGRRLRNVIGDVTPLLPARGPISIFVHHNTLHAYEYLPFESAVVEAADLFGCEPFLTEAEYRRKLIRGRILDADLRAVLVEDLGRQGDERVAWLIPRIDFQLGLLRHQVREVRGPALEWMLSETGACIRWRHDLDLDTDRCTDGRPIDELARVRRLWEGCRAAADGHVEEAPSPSRPPVRHRDLLLAMTGADSDALVHPLLIRFSLAGFPPSIIGRF